MKSFLMCCFSLAVSVNCYGQIVSYPSANGSYPAVQASAGVVNGVSNVIPAGAAIPAYPNSAYPNSAYPNSAYPNSAYPSGAVPASNYSASGVAPATLPWYQTLTDQREHDFGTVARASKQVHVFEFKNTTGADLLLNQVRTSCGCTKPKILTQHVKPDQIGKVEATFDTLKFFGKRGATLSVSVQKLGQYSEYAEVQFAVKGKIRRDVVVSPGMFDFQDVNVSETAKRTAKLWYAGKPDWKILDVKSTNSNLKIDFKELERDPVAGKVLYELVVNLNEDQPAGQFLDNLTIVTNDPATSGMPVEVCGSVNTVINIAPIALGVVNQGQVIEKKLIVRSPIPISIDEIQTSCEKIKFAPSEGKKTLHILKYSFDTSEPTDVLETVTISTTGEKARSTQVSFSAQVVASTSAVDPVTRD